MCSIPSHGRYLLLLILRSFSTAAMQKMLRSGFIYPPPSKPELYRKRVKSQMEIENLWLE
jgi:hypothetical protein